MLLPTASVSLHPKLQPLLRLGSSVCSPHLPSGWMRLALKDTASVLGLLTDLPPVLRHRVGEQSAGFAVMSRLALNSWGTLIPILPFLFHHFL